MADESYSFVVVSNRLPVDHVVEEDGSKHRGEKELEESGFDVAH